MITNGSILKVKNLLPLQRLPFIVPNNGSTVPNIAVVTTKIVQVFCQRHYTFLWSLSIHSDSSCQSLEETIKGAIVSQSYQQIPALLSSSKGIGWNQNPFSFLSTFPFKCRTQIIDEILQSFVPLRPRSSLQVAYDCLLSYTLQNPQPFPLALAILQRTIRSGCIPVPQIHLLLSSAWMDHRNQSLCVRNLLLEMQSIGYHPDCGTCNYIISSLCFVDQLEEAIEVLRGMTGAACVPDLESYGTVIAAMCALRQTTKAIAMMKEMVRKFRLSPRQGMLIKMMLSLRANKEIWRAVEIIEFLEKKGFHVGFESYELVIEGCLECAEFVLAGKVVVRMTQKGLIPYLKVRQKVIEGLVGVGEWKLACAVRHRFAELNS